MLNLNAIILFSENPGKLVAFYKKILGMDPGWTGGDFTGFKVGSGFLTIGPHSDVKGTAKDPKRMMFFFETTDVAGQHKRMVGLGAKEIAAPYHPGEASDMRLSTLADPDGNYFQLATPMDMPKAN